MTIGVLLDNIALLVIFYFLNIFLHNAHILPVVSVTNNKVWPQIVRLAYRQI